MILRFEQIVKNDFVRNVFTLFLGNAIAQGITLISIPILTRLYTPEEFGAVALFIGIVNVIAVASNGRYDMSIMLPKREGQAFHILIGSMVLVLLFSLLSLLSVIIFYDQITGVFEAKIYRKIIWLLPLYFLLEAIKAFTIGLTGNARFVLWEPTELFRMLDKLE
jgi:O-antigen/teichoic acid export membrane protein